MEKNLEEISIKKKNLEHKYNFQILMEFLKEEEEIYGYKGLMGDYQNDKGI